MKATTRLAAVVAATLSVAVQAQAPAPGCTSEESKRLDFRVGNWEAIWQIAYKMAK